MPRTRKPPEPPETYVVSANPNDLEIILARSLQAATRPLYEEIGQLRQEIGALKEQQRALVSGFEQMQQSHIEQLRLLAERLREAYPDEA